MDSDLVALRVCLADKLRVLVHAGTDHKEGRKRVAALLQRVQDALRKRPWPVIIC